MTAVHFPEPLVQGAVRPDLLPEAVAQPLVELALVGGPVLVLEWPEKGEAGIAVHVLLLYEDVSLAVLILRFY